VDTVQLVSNAENSIITRIATATITENIISVFFMFLPIQQFKAQRASAAADG
jgi:hypothetical protein